MNTLIGKRVHRYELQTLIGEGSTGVVYRAMHTPNHEHVAVKCLKIAQASSATTHLERFRREGKLLRDMAHPNIVKLLDVFEAEGQHFLVMEYVPGGSLRDLLDQQPQLPLQHVLWIALDLADALTRAHRLGIIHRDLKPANVLLAEDGTPRLTDFGIAYLAGNQALTQEGALIGTPNYLSPETINQQPIDERADIWSFGVLLFEMLAGRRPFEGELLTTVLNAILHEPLPDLEALRPDMPVALIDLLYRMLEKDRQARIPSIRLVGAELEALLHAENLADAVLDDDVDRRTVDGSLVFTAPPPENPGVTLNFPVQTTPFIGREVQLAALAQLLSEPNRRLITLLGPGGIGKTRLALAVAEQQRSTFARGAYFVALASLSDPAQIVPGIAEAVGLRLGSGIPGGGLQPGMLSDDKQQLLSYLRKKELLLVLDNFEHLLGGAPLVIDILQTAPRVKVLATSRERLNLSGETLFTLTGMSFPDWKTLEDALEYAAVKLFMSGAQRVDPGFQLDPENLHHVARICRLVDGMPLGILLAAAWVDMFSPQEIADEIARGLDFLETELRDVPDRHRSIRAIFDSAWDRLNHEERIAFTKLAVFRGGFTRQAAEYIAGAGLRMLTGLVNKSLLRRDPASGRYELHELLRQYLEERLELSDEVAVVRDAHSIYYLDALARSETDLKGAHPIRALNVIEADWENIRAAWLYGVARDDVKRLQSAVISLSISGAMRVSPQEVSSLMEAALQALEADAPTAEHEILLGTLLVYEPPRESVQARRERGIRLLRQHDMGSLLYPGLGRLADILAAEGRYKEAESLLDENLALTRANGSSFDIGHALVLKGDFLANRDLDHQAALPYWQEAYAIFQSIDNPIGLAMVLQSLSNQAVESGDWTKAESLLEESRKYFAAIGSKGNFAYATMLLGWYAYRQGHIARGGVLLEDSLTQFHDLGQDGEETYARLAFVYVAAGDYPSARDAIVRTLKTYWLERHNTRYVLAALIAAAFLRIAEGQSILAVELLARALTDPVCVPQLHTLTESLRADLRAELAPDIYDTALAHGKALNLDATVVTLIAELSTPADSEIPDTYSPGTTPLPESLTEREADVLGLLVQGLSNRQIAEELVLAVGTVKTHTHNLYGKLNVSNRTEAAARARELGLV